MPLIGILRLLCGSAGFEAGRPYGLRTRAAAADGGGGRRRRRAAAARAHTQHGGVGATMWHHTVSGGGGVENGATFDGPSGDDVSVVAQSNECARDLRGTSTNRRGRNPAVRPALVAEHQPHIGTESEGETSPNRQGRNLVPRPRCGQAVQAWLVSKMPEDCGPVVNQDRVSATAETTDLGGLGQPSVNSPCY